MTSLAEFCGGSNGSALFVVWDSKAKQFGDCFQWVCLTGISHLVLTIVAAFLLGKLSGKTIRISSHSKVGKCRLVLCYLQAVIEIVSVILAYTLNHVHPPAFVLSKTLAFTSWLMCALLCHRLLSNTKLVGFILKVLMAPITLILVSSSIQLYDYIVLISKSEISTKYSKWYVPANFSLDIFFVFAVLVGIRLAQKSHFLHRRQLPSLVSTGIQASTDEDTSSKFPEEDALLGTHIESYNSFTFGEASHIRDSTLGWADEEANIFSKIFFHWVNSLMRKGNKSLLRKADDLFLPPMNLDTKMIKEIFQSILRLQKLSSHFSYDEMPNRDSGGHRKATLEKLDEGKRKPLRISLTKALYRAFGIVFMAAGILKFLADCISFAGPVLLDHLVSFMENKKEPMSHGYYYALGLLLSTLISSLLNAQFSYQINKVQLQCRAALITTVYEKALSVSSTSLSMFSTGQVLNFMSTDTDRIINFCNSFHQFWSLPFQVAVSLYLLYQQVGVAFLAGVVFAILLIPINRWIAIKIMKLSQTMMDQKDERVKLISECLYGIRMIKFCAWEDYFMSNIEGIRKRELSSLKGRKYLDALCVYFWATTPVLISILTFITYVLMGNKLTAAKVFTSIALFNILIAPLNAFPWVINGLMESWVSVKRVERFLTLHELSPEDYYARLFQDDLEDCVLEVDSGKFKWKGWMPKEGKNDKKANSEEEKRDLQNPEYDVVEQPFCLENVNLKIQKGDLIGVIGKVGSGKSSLLAAITAEMERLHGEVYLAEDIDGFGFVSQDPWIQHMTIRDNILFGKPFYHKEYCEVIKCCALQEDFDSLPAGDQTEVGEQGVTLSGGQKARVALARAVYQKKDIYLLDDPLSAVDAHVAQHIFSQCIMGKLKKKTRILCTHHTKFLTQADLIIVVDDGKIVMSGSPEEILNRVDGTQDGLQFINDESATGSIDQQDSQKADRSLVKKSDVTNLKEDKLVQEEEMESGTVAFSVYKQYWKSVGHILSISVLLFVLLMQASRNISDWWLAYWISHEKQHHRENKTVSSSEGSIDPSTKFYITVYGGLAGANTIFTLFRAFLFAYGGIEAARFIHKKLLTAIFCAPISFFDVTPIGRIVNRFSSDVYSVDDSLPFMLNIFLAQSFGVLGTIVITCYGIPWFTAVLVPLGIVYIYTQNYYRKTSRELKRIMSVSLSPIYEHFSETLSGLSTIRALRDTARFTEENEVKLDDSQRANFAGLAASVWLMIRLQMIGVAMVTMVSFLAVIEHHINSIDPGLVGLAIAYALSITNRLSGLVTSFTETEKQMVSVERAQQYIDGTPHEEDEGREVDTQWPKTGVIAFVNVTLVYRPGLPPALKEIAFNILDGEKIGICGRTGSGKSSLLLVLFRMINIEAGSIRIDGVNIQNIPLKKLRSKMAVIPQDPFLFDSSFRENVDPLCMHSDEELLSTLERCHLLQKLNDMGGLSAKVGERGQNLSIGQRQLLCLSRALLKKSKIICIDEATASVDLETDKLIQKTIREEFSESTVLTIAHRIETILDSDRVIVMDKGRVQEMDNPQALLSDSKSIFYSLLNESFKNT